MLNAPPPALRLQPPQMPRRAALAHRVQSPSVGAQPIWGSSLRRSSTHLKKPTRCASCAPVPSLIFRLPTRT
eukprot:366144-Chlamydomonas_euryale.AAC.7